MNGAAKKAKRVFSGLGNPPAAEEAVRVLEVPHTALPRPSEPMVQLNCRVPASTKRRVRLLAARDNASLSELIARAIDAYEERYGSAPDV